MECIILKVLYKKGMIDREEYDKAVRIFEEKKKTKEV